MKMQTLKTAVEEIIIPELDKIKSNLCEPHSALKITNEHISFIFTLINDLSRRIDETNKRIDEINNRLNSRLDETHNRIDNLNH